MRLSFVNKSGRVDILLCFECDVLLVGRDGHFISGEDFDCSRAVFVRAAKEAFPNDDLMQQLDEDRFNDGT